MKKTGLVVLGLILLIGIGFGVKMYMDNQTLNEDMQEVVNSEEAKKVFEEGLKNLDKNALTDKGIIKTYKIDDGSIEHNPMGGIMVRLYINGDDKLYIDDSLNKYDGSNLEGGGSAISPKLSKLLEKGDSQ
ncbi:hypothetical protein MFLO_09262 [Listeria floridensis FSL S10-1187]|uniref:DUF1310 family protein n=1 Tax=Listeria floridensis FSL S10-1187 TaxID=1265817 RepID=A0ABN0REN8_9LIST|nr:DUF1310 family protein [Listeria floridensis]EUJ31232.1 hypothetical protein MFLO_09262 [Listeria floridensis FSL S10-1187]